MSDAKRCDRCGNYYMQVMLNKMNAKFRVVYTTTDKKYDLCPDCQELLEKFLNIHEQTDADRRLSE